MSLMVLTVFGCSNRAIYENAQINQRDRCLKLPPGQYDECMEKVNKSYDDYEKERQEALKH